jgi:RHS repeat-associated protein
MSDHLGSTSLIVDSNMNKVGKMRYKPWGELRYSWGLQATDYQYTGQRNVVSIGLYFYQSRFYDPTLGRFIQADTIVPSLGNPMAWDRFAYAFNNVLKFTDPSGHNPQCGPDGVFCDNDPWNDYDYDPDIIDYGRIMVEIAHELEKLTGETITLRTVLRLIFEREFNGYENLEDTQKNIIAGVFSEAAGRNYWVWSQKEYGKHTTTTLLNWVGRHNQVASTILNYLRENGEEALPYYFDETRSHAGNAHIANGIVSGLFYTLEEWKVYSSDAPLTWAHCTPNECLIHENKQDAFYELHNTNWENGAYQFTTDVANMYFKWGPSYIITGNQRKYWNYP